MEFLRPTASGRVRVYVKRQLRLDLLDYDRQQMYRLGVFGLGEVLARLSKGISAEDSKAKPLSKTYAIRKSRAGLKNIRDLRGFGNGGNMLDNLKVRTVGLNDVRAGFSTKRMREKALGNQRREPFMLFSPSNQRRVAQEANEIMARKKIPFMVIKKAFDV